MTEAPAGSFLSLAPEEAEKEVVARGGRAFHARVIRRELLERGVLRYDAMTSLGAGLRRRLEESLPLLSARETAPHESPDGTTKLLLAYASGGTVETVHMPAHPRAGAPRRGATLCVSTQVGCPVGCPFCASGKAGLERNLAAHEIVEQFLLGRALGGLSRAVVMGIGEPLLNPKSLLEAARIVNAELALGARKITVSTVGYPDRVRRLAAEKPPFQLAISLHSPDDEERGALVPAMRDVPVEEVLRGGDDWFRTTGREVTYEYVLLGGLNDTDGHARRLSERLASRRATVNLIPFNPIDDGEFARPSKASAERFRDALTAKGIVATVRWSRGVDAAAACGQLRIRGRG